MVVARGLVSSSPHSSLRATSDQPRPVVVQATPGIGLALGIATDCAFAGQPDRMIVSGPSIALAFAVSTVVGAVSRLLPARDASRLDPVEALALR